MERKKFRDKFGSDHAVVLPVIHVIDEAQTLANIARAKDGGCPGVFLINHDFGIEPFLAIIRAAREAWPDFWIGINFLAVTGDKAFPVLGRLQAEGCAVDAYWADDARIDETQPPDNQPEAAAILKARKKSGWSGLYFGGTAFKKQREVDPSMYSSSAAIACAYMDVVTTSGVATGHAADTGKIKTFRDACGENAIALASGITPENAHQYADQVDCLMVATGINVEGDFYNICPKRLNQLMDKLKGEQS
jgi:predicted TIM-barrel enzyme